MKITIKKITIKKIGLIFLGIFLTLLILEVGLRISGFVFLALQRQDNRIVYEMEDIYSILALGESTTANLRDGQSSWPEELGIILNSRGKDIEFSVFNEGTPSITTSEILSKLEHNLDKYKPAMVITMMGTNDVGVPDEYKDTLTSKFNLFLKEFRTFKLAKFIMEAFENKPEINEDKLKESGYGKKEYEETEKKLKKAVEMNPQNETNLITLIKFYETNKNYKKAGDEMKKLIPLLENDTIQSFTLAVLFFEREMYEEAEEVLKKSIEIEPNLESFLLLGTLYNEVGSYEEAEKTFKKAIDLNPNGYDTYGLLGTLYSDMNRSKEAVDMHEKYLTIMDKMNIYDEHVYIQLARNYIRLNRNKEAFYVLNAVISKNPYKTQEVFWIGDIYQQVNKTPEAISLFLETVKKNPDNTAAYTELAWYYKNNNRVEEAEENLNGLKKIIEKNPNNQPAYVELVWYYLQNNRVEEAKEILILAEKQIIEPSTLPRVYLAIGEHYEENGQFEKADEMFNTAVQLRSKKYYLIITQQNYHELYRILSQRGIKLVVMQYPTRDVTELKKIFEGDEEIAFVSNEDSFKKALASSPWEEYFTDHFREDFGHATKKGNRLIAENVANVILKEFETN